MGKHMFFLCLLLCFGELHANFRAAYAQNPCLYEDDVYALAALANIMKTSPIFTSTACADQPQLRNSGRYNCSCSFRNGTVCRLTSVDFSGVGLEGYFPREIFDLEFLEYLDLSYNQMYGAMPDSFERLPRLINLDLSDNKFNREIPPSLGNLRQLQFLDLSDNKLDGSIPDSFVNLSKLEYLYLYRNNLRGSIEIVGQLKSLNYIDLSFNWFNGVISREFGNLLLLKYLRLNQNLLAGQIPVEIGNLTSLYLLDVTNNRLSGVLPPELGKLINMLYLYLGNNEFNGALPGNFTALGSLMNFYVHGNNLMGNLPNISNWRNLSQLVLLGNNFEGPLPDVRSSLSLTRMHISDMAQSKEGRYFQFSHLSNWTYLLELTLRKCSMKGEIPDIFDRMISLNYLDLSFNDLTGAIPMSLNNTRLKYIYLKHNQLNGPVLNWLNSTRSYVDISENNFTSVPERKRGVLKNVNTYACCSSKENPKAAWQTRGYHCDKGRSLHDNLYIKCGGLGTHTNGSNYEADVDPNGQSIFFLSDDKRWGYSSMGKFLFASRDKYIWNRNCGISMNDAPLYTSARVSALSLKYFGFCLRKVDYIVQLHFAEIVWGDKNDSTSRGERLFDLEIQGEKVRSNFNIEKVAGGVNKNATLVFNTTIKDRKPLEIHLYWAGKGTIFPPAEYYGPLISAISVFPVPKGKKLPPIAIAGIVAAALLVPSLIFVFLRKMGYLGSKPTEVLVLPGGYFTFQQLKDATDNFDPRNKLGEGGFGTVYKGELQDGTFVAVKQLSAKSKQGSQEFTNELGTIFALRHENLVRLLGGCCEDDQLLLVYEYMENNSLHHALFGSAETRSKLTWPVRFEICLGIARGLAFIHESKLKIVHRDIKPTNVLLDKEFNAKISDFGIAKLCETEKGHMVTVTRTTEYMAREYAMQGLLTNKADVYSFGIVALQIVSGRPFATPIPNSDDSIYLDDKALVLQKRGELISLVDPELRGNYPSKQAMTMLDLAMECVNQSHTLRPTMSEVVNRLEGGKSKRKAPDELATPKEEGPDMLPPTWSEASDSGSARGASA